MNQMVAMEGEAPNMLREYFGNRDLPDISRKLTACVACRKQKIKCHMQEGLPPCTRCKKRGVSCTVNRSLQMLLEGDADWKTSVVQRLTNLETAMGKVADATALKEIHDLINHVATPPLAFTGGNAGEEASASPQQNGQDERTWEIDIDAVGGAAAIPASHLAERVQSNIASPLKERSDKYDLISRGVVTLERARELFSTYHDKYDHYVYRILGDYRSLESVRSASPLLLAAICAVSSLQTASADFEKCYQAFLKACSARAFTKDCATEDVQAYCIGAFWLNDMSWNLVGAAVRTATQLQLHRSIYKALEGDRLSYLRTRLFYLVYVCDHHFSITYGRPPMTGSSSDVVNSWHSFLKSTHAYEDDARLVSQVHFWTIVSRVQNEFGTNVEALLPAEALVQIRRFVIELDTCRADWSERFSRSAHIGNYPRKGVGLHHHFAKLYLCSHVFRARATIISGMVSELDEIVSISVSSATFILTSLASDQEIQSYLDGLPSYFFTMITFASVFLLKVAQRYPDIPCIHKNEILNLISRVVATLRLVSANMHQRHLLTSIVYGLDKVLARVPNYSSQMIQPIRNNTSDAPNSTDLMPQADPAWFTSPSDISLWENYDFLSFQNLPSGFDFGTDFQS